MNITLKQYKDAIPKCCVHQSVKEHMDMMLCWGLVRAIEEDCEVNCDNCPNNISKDK